MRTTIAPFKTQENGGNWTQPLPTVTGPAEALAGASDHANLIDPETALAGGVLRQAASDLRRFRASEDAAGREIYRDARSWFNSNDTAWPYSFLNVCQSLGISPDDIRAEIFADAQAGWLSHARRVAIATATQFVGSVLVLSSSRRSRTLTVQPS